MEKIAIIPEIYTDLVNLINTAPYCLAERPLTDHLDYINYNRKLVITGLNIPDLEDAGDKRIFISLCQILINKDTGDTYKKFPSFLVEINSIDLISIRKPENITENIEVGFKIVEDNKIVSKNKGPLDVNAIDYFKSMLFNKNFHLKDILEIYLADYIAKHENELNNI